MTPAYVGRPLLTCTPLSCMHSPQSKAGMVPGRRCFQGSQEAPCAKLRPIRNQTLTAQLPMTSMIHDACVYIPCPKGDWYTRRRPRTYSPARELSAALVLLLLPSFTTIKIDLAAPRLRPHAGHELLSESVRLIVSLLFHASSCSAWVPLSQIRRGL